MGLLLLLLLLVELLSLAYRSLKSLTEEDV